MRFFSILVLLCATISLDAQLQHSQWFMGFNAALDFSTLVPAAMPGVLSTDEGCTTISDSTGQLLFTTNGEQVWNRNQIIMPNGSGLNGHFSSSQSALVVPFPDNALRYYIFTTPAEAGTWTGVTEGYYSIIDMSLNNGLGDVLTKNVLLTPAVAEKLTATKHANGRDIWVLYHGWNSSEYLAYLVTCDGIKGPVISDIGYYAGPDAQGYTNSAIGCMKLNRQGTQLASVWTDPVLSTPQVFESWMILNVLDFDNATGVLSNLQADTVGAGNEILKGYGVEFSPSGKVLYTNDHGLINGISSSNVYQYDLTAANPMNTRLLVGGGNPAHGSMQLGPDGKLYIARLNGANYLSTIEAPDVLGMACSYVSNSASLGGGVSTWGLPNHWDSYDTPPVIDPIAWTDSTSCNGSIIVDAIWQHPFENPQYLWSTGETTPTIQVSTSGMYAVEIMLACSSVYDTVNVNIAGAEIDLGEAILACEGQEIKLTVTPNGASVLWSTGSMDSTITVEETGNYGVVVTDSSNCSNGDSVQIEFENCECPVYIPNTFSPNGDGINDVFIPVIDCATISFELLIYNRWGKLQYISTDPLLAWEPKRNTQGVFVYTLSYAWNGLDRKQRKKISGHITAIN